MAKLKIPTLDEMRQFKKDENLNLVDVDLLFSAWSRCQWHDSKGDPIKNWKNKLRVNQCFQEKKQGIKNGIIKREELNRKEKIDNAHPLFSKEMTANLLKMPEEPKRQILQQFKAFKNPITAPKQTLTPEQRDEHKLKIQQQIQAMKGLQ